MLNRFHRFDSFQENEEQNPDYEEQRKIKDANDFVFRSRLSTSFGDYLLRILPNGYFELEGDAYDKRYFKYDETDKIDLPELRTWVQSLLTPEAQKSSEIVYKDQIELTEEEAEKQPDTIVRYAVSPNKIYYISLNKESGKIVISTPASESTYFFQDFADGRKYCDAVNTDYIRVMLFAKKYFEL